ncbi:MAG: response regulator transcription factor [Mesorhizobium sp.]|nr:MAG: response regulator transcription factor [Mesorhizobium sp.]
MSGLEEPRWPAHAANAVEANLVLGVALMKPRVLICSQDAELYLFLSHILEADGFASEPARGAKEALGMFDDCDFQAVVLDCGSTSLTGSAICARLKREPRTSGLLVIALIAAGAEYQYLDLLKAGIDESIPRPLSPIKLLDCLRARLGPAKQPGSNRSGNGRCLSFGSLEMRLDARRVYCNGKEIHLGPIEFNVLRHLLETPGKVFSRDELIGAAWPPNIHVGERTVDVHISRLRRALEPSTDIVIRTVRSAGYSLEKLDG